MTFAREAIEKPRGKDGISPLETRLFGRSTMLWKGPAALRIVVSDHDTGRPLPAWVTVALAPVSGGKGPQSVLSGETDALGTLDSTFTVSTAAPGPHRLIVEVHTALGDDRIVQQVDVEPRVQMLLTADKPMYQPGQMIHMRVLARDQGTGGALSDQPVTFEVEDARGNKVFKEAASLSRFGVAGADFGLADEVNMGVFTLRVIAGAAQTEKKVTVARYVLPRYKVTVATDKPYYLPGQTVSGTLKARYLFGKPVTDASVHIGVNTMDVGVSRLAALDGKTDAEGVYHFKTQLPDHFVGQPFEQGKAVVELAAEVKDTADHVQQQSLSVPVVQDPLLVAIVPETRTAVPDVVNRAWVAVATPDGAPVRNCALQASVAGKTVGATTDALGIAMISYTPDGSSNDMTVTARDSEGRTATQRQTIALADSKDGVILRVDKTLARVGESLRLTGVSTAKRGTLYIDVIRDKQTILTRALPIQGGVAALTVPVTPDMEGTLEIHGYRILPDENIVRDTRTVIVSPADDLKVTLTADKAVYRPGEDAALMLHVSDPRGAPVSAAVGLAIVDESVFALSELRPGLEKIYFTLEKELMEPKYEIHGLTPTTLLRSDAPSQSSAADARQRAAAMLLAAVPSSDPFDFRVNTYHDRYQKMVEDARARMQRSYTAIVKALAAYRQKMGKDLSTKRSLEDLVLWGYLKQSDLLDRWGRFYRTGTSGAPTYTPWFTLSSAGPDGEWGTTDDVVWDVAVRGLRSAGEARGFGGGGFGGRFRENEGVVNAAAPMAAAMDRFEVNRDMGQMKAIKGSAQPESSSSSGAPRVRQYFPETLYWNPAIITDARGQAPIHVPMADSITTWRVSMLANTRTGVLGSAAAPVRVFQDFFVDLDLPVSFTQNDQISVPVAVYNYLPKPQNVTLTVAAEPWFRLRGPERQSIPVGPGDVKVVYFPITVRAIGSHTLTVTARGTSASDAVRRAVDVLPYGKEFPVAVGDTLSSEGGPAARRIDIPAKAIPNATALWVKLYPGTFSQVVDGLDGLLRMPNGCFEQTSSTTYPNVLVLDYLKQTKRINPEIQMKAEQMINVGYQRLVTFECKSGGFSWFGNEPAHQILTAYGLLEFGDMSRVHDVDPAILTRTSQWLAGKQKEDGSWEETSQGIAEGIINRQTGALRSTAYIAWALAETGYRGPALAKGVAYVRAHRGEATDPYTLAVILNLLAKVDRSGGDTAGVAKKLIDMAHTTEKTAFWQSDTQTFTGARSAGADLETTGLAAYGLVKWGGSAGFINKVLTYLVQSKDSYGTWSTTQGTVWSLKALLYASRNSAGGRGTVTILVNGQRIATSKITPQNSDVMQQIRIPSPKNGANEVTLQYSGEGSLAYQIAGRYYLPWPDEQEPAARKSPLSIDVQYDKTSLSQNDTVTLTATVHNNTDRRAEMPLIDLGVPPGFTVDPSALDAAVSEGKISKYTIAARQVIVYLEKLDPNATLTLSYKLQARFPIRAKTPQSKVYPYYNPELAAIASPRELAVN